MSASMALTLLIVLAIVIVVFSLAFLYYICKKRLWRIFYQRCVRMFCPSETPERNVREAPTRRRRSTPRITRQQQLVLIPTFHHQRPSFSAPVRIPARLNFNDASSSESSPRRDNRDSLSDQLSCASSPAVRRPRLPRDDYDHLASIAGPVRRRAVHSFSEFSLRHHQASVGRSLSVQSSPMRLSRTERHSPAKSTRSQSSSPTKLSRSGRSSPTKSCRSEKSPAMKMHRRHSSSPPKRSRSHENSPLKPGCSYSTPPPKQSSRSHGNSPTKSLAEHVETPRCDLTSPEMWYAVTSLSDIYPEGSPPARQPDNIPEVSEEESERHYINVPNNPSTESDVLGEYVDLAQIEPNYVVPMATDLIPSPEVEYVDPEEMAQVLRQQAEDLDLRSESDSER